MITSRTPFTLRRAILSVVVFGLLFPALFISGYSSFKRYNEDLRRQTAQLLQQNVDVLASGMQEPLWNINHESGDALLDAMLSPNEDIVRIEVRDSTLGLFVVGERIERRTGETARAEKPVMYRGKQIGSVTIEVVNNRLRTSIMKGLIESMIAVTAQAALSIVLILLLLERRLIGPLRRLGVGAQRLAERQLDVPFTWKRLDEIGMLGRRLEDTRVSLRALFDELDRKNRELEQDIDKRKHVEQELHKREERYRTLVEHSPIAIIEWDAEWRVVEWNDAAERIFGYLREQAIGRHAGFIVAESDLDMLTRHFDQPGGNGRTLTHNHRADGSSIVCQWSHTQIRDENGNTVRLLSIAEDITDKRQAEEDRMASEAKFSGAFECNPDGIAIMRLDNGKILDINTAGIKITGFSREETIGKSSVELNLWAEPAQRMILFARLGRERTVSEFQWSMQTKAGDIRKCVVNGTVFEVGDDKYVLTVVRDVTDQLLLEAQKSEADRALLRLAQGTQDIAGESFFELLVADLASALRVERAFIALRVAEEPDRMRSIAAHAKGRTIEDFDYGIDGTPCHTVLEGDICVFADAIQDRFPKDTPLAQYGCESYAGAPLRDSAGNIIGVLAVMHTRPLGNPSLVKSLLQVFSERASAELERKRAEQELRNSEQRFSKIFQSSPIAMFVTQVRGGYKVKDVNAAFERLFLRSREHVIGRSTAELSLYCDMEERTSLIQELRDTGATSGTREVWMFRGDGNRILIQFSGYTFNLAGEKFGILACADVTEMRRFEDEIRELNATLEQRVIERTEELQQANEELAYTLETLNKAQEELVRSGKLAALGSLVAGIAHELNTPIGNSLMVASTLADQTRSLSELFHTGAGMKRSELERFLQDAGKAGDIMVRNLHRAADLVAGFKQVAVDQISSQRRRFPLAETVSEIILTLWPTLKKTDVNVSCSIPADMMMDSYPGPLGQAITNLINNAVVHAFGDRSSGTLWISAHAVDDGWIEITLMDNGAGIPPANLNRIFDPFFTTRLGAGGSGLGLNITHNIVTGVLGGKIQVQSEIGVGTVFVLHLPSNAPQRQADTNAAKSGLTLV
ncbi:PAS domain S-box protein [Noviherbaspirillum sp.]|uniref:PAS domain S-box protein n=1 Tax=Noviherbaspirillum sp. TaxID=1926288 RepID=UPI002FE390D6